MRWALEAIVLDHLTVSRAAAGLGVSWHTANTAILAEGKRRLIDDPARFDGVRVIGVDEHVVRHEALLFRMEARDVDRLVVVAAGIQQGWGPGSMRSFASSGSRFSSRISLVSESTSYSPAKDRFSV
jgi:hypothetical protein